MSGKGSKPRPFTVTKEDFSSNWDRIFNVKNDNTGIDKNEYQDILSTEDAVISALDKMEEK
jgi:hypothetical protein